MLGQLRAEGAVRGRGGRPLKKMTPLILLNFGVYVIDNIINLMREKVSFKKIKEVRH